jgi:hypothetical protein
MAIELSNDHSRAGIRTPIDHENSGKRTNRNRGIFDDLQYLDLTVPDGLPAKTLRTLRDPAGFVHASRVNRHN